MYFRKDNVPRALNFVKNVGDLNDDNGRRISRRKKGTACCFCQTLKKAPDGVKAAVCAFVGATVERHSTANKDHVNIKIHNCLSIYYSKGYKTKQLLNFKKFPLEIEMMKGDLPTIKV